MSVQSKLKNAFLNIFGDKLSEDKFRQHILSKKLSVPPGKSILIMGNGPSLSKIDMSRIDSSIDTIGMNVAFRYWNKINWYPKIYSCLDTVVVEHHHQEISKLYKSRHENGIQLFYLQKNILNKQPWLLNVENVLFLDDWFGSYLYSKCPSVTTGSYSVLLAIALGYKTIYLTGVDLNYVEIIKNATRIGDNVLEIRSQPLKNPNYFFDEYQMPGDKYHVPNSVPSLLINSWEEISDLASELDIKIYNGNADSAVNQLFPYRNITEFIY